jgi:hypothetical protein
MKKNFNQFRQEYGDKAKEVMYATATKRAMEEETNEEEVYVEHWCAKHVYHDVYGEGVVLEGEHDLPDENGFISWYTVKFDHGNETVFTEDVEIMHERHHGHMMKKKKKMSEDNHEMGHDVKSKKRMAQAKKNIKDVDKVDDLSGIEEELTGDQHKIDANKNNKIDAQDFKLLKKIKKARS